MNAKPSKPQRRRISQPVHVRCWIDNAAAVAWIGRHYATNITAQELTRVLSCAELQLKIHVSTSHLQGSSNFLAGLGSRSWSGEKRVTWTNYMRLWQQQEIPSLFRKIYKSELPIFSGVHSQTHQGPAISKRGGNGACLVSDTACPNGSLQPTQTASRYNSLCLLLAAGKPTPTRRPAVLTQYALSSAISDGVIACAPDSAHHCNHNTNSCCEEFTGSAPRASTTTRLHSTCSKQSCKQQTCQVPNTVSFVGLRCWASTFV
ncbi:hypothetical protein JG688_00014546 [Phytophthora aleatoria]|uniref:Uncharacterized protein n=1 Tax=Phytophthora aleatoria TaxID=2496075 RepID=A0A8J5MDW9_9STRA|nr:hypothetical protein JG688_00014546 [Phytophthora aleatoria]